MVVGLVVVVGVVVIVVVAEVDVAVAVDETQYVFSGKSHWFVSGFK